MRSVLSIAAAAFLLALAASCTRPNESYGCVPGEQKACACPDATTGAQRCRADGSGFDACLGCGETIDLGAGTDLSAALDMSVSPSDLASVMHDLAIARDMAHRDFTVVPTPADLAGVDFTGISCGATTCASGACCVTPSAGAPTKACVAGTTCTGGAYPLLCDGAEDCGPGASACCITGSSSGGSTTTTGSMCTASCAAAITGGGGGSSSFTTKLCHGAADCVGYMGTTMFGAMAFDRCCTTTSLGVHYCAPSFVSVVTVGTTCD